MTEDQIETKVSRMIDRVDAQFLAPGSMMTQAEYDAVMRGIHDWAEREYVFAAHIKEGR